MANKKQTVKGLQLEINELKKELKDVIEELKEIKANLNPSSDKNEHDSYTKTQDRRVNLESKCRVCDQAYNSRKDLKLHIKVMHRGEIKCKECEESFDQNSDLERHLQICHEEAKQFKCDVCDKAFVLEWRLQKHKGIHSIHKPTKCHYFNNRKDC